MARPKAKPKPAKESFAQPFSVLLFEHNLRILEKTAAESGIAKSVLLRLLVRDAIASGHLSSMVEGMRHA